MFDKLLFALAKFFFVPLPGEAGPNPFPDFSMALEEPPQGRRTDFLAKDLFNFRQPPMGASLVVLQPLQNLFFLGGVQRLFAATPFIF